MKPHFTFLCTLCFCSLLIGQRMESDSITVLQEVILLDSLKGKQATGIIPSELIGPKTFKNYSPSDIVSSLNQIPGVFVLSGALNTNRITIRGVGARTPYGTDKIRLYYNEIPLTNGTGVSTIEAFDLESMNSIEVIKGPKATAFGTNLGGALIINPKEALIRSTTLSNSFTVGSYNLLKNSLSFTHSDDNYALELRYGHMSIDGYRKNNKFERDGILLNTSYQLTNKSKISFLLNHIDYTAQIASSINQTNFNEDPTQAAFTWAAAQGYEANSYTVAGLSFENKLSSDFKNTSSLFYTYLDHYEPRPFNILDEFTNGLGFRTRFNGTFKLKEKIVSYTFGGEIFKDQYNWGTFQNLYEENNGEGSLQGNRISKNYEKRNLINGFSSITFPVASYFTAQFGLNVNKTSYNLEDQFNTGENDTSGKREFDLIVLPNFTLDYTFYPKQRIYLNISRGYSNPSLEQTLTPDGIINPDISQETGTNYELGSQLSLADTNLKINIALYRMSIKNLLVAQRVGDDQYIGRNAGSTKHQGIEIDMNYKLTVSPKISMTPFISYSFSNHKFVDFLDEENNYSGNQLTGVPKHRINSGIQILERNGFYWNTTHSYVSSIPLTDSNSLSSKPYNILNTRLGYNTSLSETLSIGLDIGINNLTDTHYAQSVLINASSFGGREPRYFYPGNARNMYGRIQLNYRL